MASHGAGESSADAEELSVADDGSSDAARREQRCGATSRASPSRSFDRLSVELQPPVQAEAEAEPQAQAQVQQPHRLRLGHRTRCRFTSKQSTFEGSLLLPCCATRMDTDILLAMCRCCADGGAYHCVGCYGAIRSKLMEVKRKRPAMEWMPCGVLEFFLATDWKELVRNPAAADLIDNEFIFFDHVVGRLVWRASCIVCMDPELAGGAAEMPEHYRRAKPTRVHEPIIIDFPAAPRLNPTTFRLERTPARLRVNTWRDVAGGAESLSKFLHYTHEGFGDVALIMDEPPTLLGGPTWDLHRTEPTDGTPSVALSLRYINGVDESMADLGGAMDMYDAGQAIQVRPPPRNPTISPARAPSRPRLLFCTTRLTCAARRLAVPLRRCAATPNSGETGRRRCGRTCRRARRRAPC